MLEARGDLWDFHEDGYTICITTNGFVKKNGEAVMGRGCAREATYRYDDIAELLGNWIDMRGNKICWFSDKRIISFPVKHHWKEEADIELIKASSRDLMDLLDQNPDTKTPIYLPRPGCGNGRLKWSDVKPVLAEVLDDRVIVVTW